MKLIGIGNNYQGREGGAMRATLLADSALVHSNKPVFLPYDNANYVLRTCLVARIGRLGKHIGRRWASRYVDAVAAGFTMQADNYEAGDPRGNSFDGAVMTGQFVSAEGIDIDNITIATSVNGTECSRMSTSLMTIGTLDLVSELSKSFTLKMGDLIFTSWGEKDITPMIGDTFTASLCIAGGEHLENLRIRIK